MQLQKKLNIQKYMFLKKTKKMKNARYHTKTGPLRLKKKIIRASQIGKNLFFLNSFLDF